MSVSVKSNLCAQFEVLLFHAGQFVNDFIGVTLINKETLSLSGISHLHRILRYQRIEECIKRITRMFFCTQNSTQPLSFLK